MGLPFKNERKQKQLYIFYVQLAILVKALKFQTMGGLYTIKTLQVSAHNFNLFFLLT